MAKQSSNDDHFDGLIELSIELFKKMECISGCISEVDTKCSVRQKAIKMVKMLDAEKMRCHILDCLVALRRIQRYERILEISNANEQYECAKKRIFASAVSMILDEEGSIESDQNVLSLLLKPFPDTKKMNDGRSWLPMHFALALGNKVREEDIHEMHSVEPLLIQRYNLVKSQQLRHDFTKYTPCYFLCIQRNPNLSLIRYLSMRNLKAFTICSHEEKWYSRDIFKYKNALHLAAKYSENVELLKILIQIDESMTKMTATSTISRFSALGILCERSSSQFSTFNSMLECLIVANSSADIISDGLQSCFQSFGGSSTKDINALLAIIQLLLEVNGIEGYDTNTFRLACIYLRGEMCIVVLRLLLTKYNEGAGLRVVDGDGDLPIHQAARYSTLDVFEYLLQAYPESGHDGNGNNFLHIAVGGSTSGDTTAKVQYLCDRFPDFINMTNDAFLTPLQHFLTNNRRDLSTITILCQADETVLSEVCTNSDYHGMLPLHLIMLIYDLKSSVSVEADIFRYCLDLHPAAVGVTDSQDRNTYDLVVSDDFGDNEDVDIYFIRMLLNADRTIAPERRLDLNYEARRDALFLSFRAVSTDREPIIWVQLRHESRDLLRHTMSYL